MEGLTSKLVKIFHYTFCTYKKKRVLVGEIAEDVGKIFQEICRTKGFELLSFNVLVDHVHILIRKKASDSNEYVMKMIKGISSRKCLRSTLATGMSLENYGAEVIMQWRLGTMDL